MKSMLIKSGIIAGTLCTVLTVPTLAQLQPESVGKDVKALKSQDEYNFSQTFKPYPLYSQDINNDGIIEVGVQSEPLEAEGYSMADMPWISNWYQWDGKDGLKKVMEEYSSYSEGYRFIIPESWSGKFTIDKDTDENYEAKAVHFIYLGENKQRAELLTIHHILKEDWSQQKQNFETNDQNYVIIGENDRNMLIVELKQNGEKLSEESNKEYEEMLLNEASIKERFKAIGDKTKLIDLRLEYPKTEEGIIKPEYAKEVIKGTADKLIYAISMKDAETISDFVHPVKGVRFTPYTHVSLESDRIFDKEEIKKFFEDQESYIWGYYDGIGDEIRLTPSEYYGKFIYSEDFINAESIGYNEVLSFGNMLENQFEVYDNPIVVEYYFSGFEPQYEGMDWKSLRLVFEEYGDSWKLVGIIHNQWTI